MISERSERRYFKNLQVLWWPIVCDSGMEGNSENCNESRSRWSSDVACFQQSDVKFTYLKEMSTANLLPSKITRLKHFES